jgi:hypothetical protein
MMAGTVLTQQEMDEFAAAIMDGYIRELTEQRDELLAAWTAACAFIDSHVADPDITQEMVLTYAEFMKHREAITKAEE